MSANNTTANQEFKIEKRYDGFPSKNKIEFTGTEEACKNYLEYDISLAKRNGANVVSESEYHFTCDDYGSNGESVTFEIVEA